MSKEKKPDSGTGHFFHKNPLVNAKLAKNVPPQDRHIFVGKVGVFENFSI
jgi:hypothetical protein